MVKQGVPLNRILRSRWVLTWKADGETQLTETRGGVPVFAGTASGLPEWKFKVQQKKNAINARKDTSLRKEKLVELTTKVVDGLTDDALKIAMDNQHFLSDMNGIDKLIAKIEEHVIAYKEDEARELFHAGTKSENERCLVNGGRVLGVTALGPTLADAASVAYETVELISWPGMQVRRDIGWRAL